MKRILTGMLAVVLTVALTIGGMPLTAHADPDGQGSGDGQTGSGEGSETLVSADIAQFPESYQAALTELKKLHPNWTFVPMNTNQEWDTVIRKEMADGKSLVHRSLENCAKEGAYDQGNWYYASKEILAYFMDPRNALTEEGIFQFEQLTYNEQYHTLEALEQFLEGTFMNSFVNVPETQMKYSYVIYMIGKEEGREISPFHLAARILQEQGQGGSALISGTYPGYEGYYNYFNIGATGTTNEDVIRNGLEYAKGDNGWGKGAYYAILGGADYIASKYIKKGQYTLYLEKFNVNPQANYSLFTHQYMQNISAPTNESSSIKSLYESANALNSPFVFQIPVYKNMPEQACARPKSSTNVVLSIPTDMTLTKLTVDGVEYEGTNYYDYANRNRRLVVTLPDGNGKKAAIEIKDGNGNITAGYYWDLTYKGTYYVATPGVKDEPEEQVEPEDPVLPEVPLELTNDVLLELPEGLNAPEIWLDGVAYAVTMEKGKAKVTAPDRNAKTAVVYAYNASGIPVDMYVWTLTYGGKGYEAQLHPQLQGLLSYHGFSIRIRGNSGIRCKTGIGTETKEKLLGEGIDGYHLKEYGTIAMVNANRELMPMIKGGQKTVSGIAYGTKADGTSMDAVFETVDGRQRFTSVLTGLPSEQYKTDFAFRGYIILEKDGQEIILYGPVVARNIYALAKQLLDMQYYETDSDADKFLKKLIMDADGISVEEEDEEGGNGEGTGEGGNGTGEGNGNGGSGNGEGTGTGESGTGEGTGGSGTGEGTGTGGTGTGEGTGGNGEGTGNDNLGGNGEGTGTGGNTGNGENGEGTGGNTGNGGSGEGAGNGGSEDSMIGV